MKRKSPVKGVEKQVLVLCRRRCSVCFGLHRDAMLKPGQIAHLDRDSSNSDLDNLVFLCLEHHDAYDTRTSQSKGLTTDEVRAYRDELHAEVERHWGHPASFDAPGVEADDQIEGHYVREGENDVAELYIERRSFGKINVRGSALWGLRNPGGPNMGDLDFLAPLSSNSTEYRDETPHGTYSLSITFEPGLAVAEEELGGGLFGMNVSFEGKYRKVGPLPAPRSSSST